MPLDSDVALLGTGVAPLIAASQLLAEGKSVLILNPDRDFFLEDSELPLDPFLPVSRATLDPARVKRSLPERVLEELRPNFPGAVEYWPGVGVDAPAGFRDPAAPYVRSRARLWVTAKDVPELEDSFIQLSDADLKPQILEGLQASRRFPGVSTAGDEWRGLLIPKVSDVDVTRYRNGLLEFVRERLGPERVVCNASQIEFMPGGVRFHAEGEPNTARLAGGMLVFWTPRLTQWILAQAKRTEVAPKLPLGVRLWEEWSLVSRYPIDASTIGMIEDIAVWAETEGVPEAAPNRVTRLAALRAGLRVDLAQMQSPMATSNWASSDAFNSLSFLFRHFLKWDRVTIRMMKPRLVFEWEDPKSWALRVGDPLVRVIPACDGPLSDVVHTARQATTRLSNSTAPSKGGHA